MHPRITDVKLRIGRFLSTDFRRPKAQALLASTDRGAKIYENLLKDFPRPRESIVKGQFIKRLFN
jgi:hypothetical protein